MRREALIAARKATDLTQAQVADAIGKDRSTYACYEAGIRTPPVPICLLISRVVGRPVEELFGDVADRNTSDARLEHTGPRERRPEGRLDGSEREVKTA